MPCSAQLLLLQLLLLGTAGVVAKQTAPCELPCHNKGVCQASGGATRHRDLVEFLPSNNNNIVDSYEDDAAAEDHPRLDGPPPRLLFEQRPHCLCPAGFTGALCEIEYVMCDSKADTCFNGLPCQRAVDDFGAEFFHCECDAAKSDLSLPGSQKFCEHVSTVFCNDNNNNAKGGDPKQRSRGSSFCNNGGRCKEDVLEDKHHAGCECRAGFSGPHCEISDHPPQQQPAGSSAYEELQAAASLASNPRRRVLLSLVVFLSIMTCFVTAGYTFVVYYGQQQQKKNWKKKGGRTAKERARIPITNYRGRSAPVAPPKQNYAPVNEIEMT